MALTSPPKSIAATHPITASPVAAAMVVGSSASSGSAAAVMRSTSCWLLMERSVSSKGKQTPRTGGHDQGAGDRTTLILVISATTRYMVHFALYFDFVSLI
jgi:hypothetical protein